MSEVTRQAFQQKIEALKVIDDLISESELTESDVEETSEKINESGQRRSRSGHL